MNPRCEICFENFNLTHRQPITVMQCGHTFCLKCLEHMQQFDHRCPKDREPITNQKPNYALIDVLNSILLQSYKKKVDDMNNKEKSLCEEKSETINERKSGEEYFKEGVSLYNSAKFRKAIEHFNKAIELDYEVSKATVKKGQSFLRLEKYSESIDCFDKCIAIAPNSNEAYLYKAICLERGGNKYEAQLMYEKANEIDFDANDAESLLCKAICLDILGSKEEAIEYFDKSIHINPTAASYKTKGDCLWDSNKLTEALDLYNKAISLNENYFIAYWGRGSILASLEMYKEAIESFEKAIKLNPTSNVYKLKASVHTKLNENDKAVKSYMNALALDPDDQDSRCKMNDILDKF